MTPNVAPQRQEILMLSKREIDVLRALIGTRIAELTWNSDSPSLLKEYQTLDSKLEAKAHD